VSESVRIIRELPAYEFRTTMVPGIVNRNDVLDLLRETGKLRRYVLQTFHSQKTLSEDLTGRPAYPRRYLEDLAETITGMELADEVSIRL